MEVLFGFLLLVALAGITAGAMVGIHKLIGPKQAGGTHEAPFECGKETYGIVKGRLILGQVLRGCTSVHPIRCRIDIPLSLGDGLSNSGLVWLR
jgi:hypothetical protein